MDGLGRSAPARRRLAGHAGGATSAKRVGVPSPAERLSTALARLRDEPGIVDLPARLSLFGLTRLPASHVDVLAALAVARDVEVFLHAMNKRCCGTGSAANWSFHARCHPAPRRPPTAAMPRITRCSPRGVAMPARCTP